MTYTIALLIRMFPFLRKGGRIIMRVSSITLKINDVAIM
jgi:hypothetical protein